MKVKKLFVTAILATTLGIMTCGVPTWVSVVEGFAKIAVPIAGSIVDLVAPELSPLVTLIENGFTALTNTLDTYKALPNDTNLQAVQAAVTALNRNITQLENAAQIKNPATDAKIKGVVALIGQLIDSIAAQVPATATTKMTVKLSRAAPSTMTADDFKAKFNTLTAGDPRFHPIQ
jgi:hypothetical protein